MKKKADSYAVGGERHLDIHVFRNDKLFAEWKNHAVYSMRDFDQHVMKGNSRGHQEEARRKAVLEFAKSLQGDMPLEPCSEITDHKDSMLLYSAVYQSAVKKQKGLNSQITVKLS
jgi:hypothetical protein